MKSPQYSRFGIVAQHDILQKHGDHPRSPTTAEHLVGEASKWSPHNSPTSRRGHEPEEDHTPHRKSVLSKVKEKARKLRHSLSGKKKHTEEENMTPSFGVTLEDEEDEEEDAEYLGAPMYESELAPEGYKEKARLHPRLIPVISEKHVLSSSIKENEKPPSPNKTTLTETVTEKLAPAYATVSDATHAIASRIQGLTVSTPTASECNEQDNLATLKQATSETDTKTNPETEKQGSPTGKKWNKGVSVKGYIKHKFEPGEEERALSKVITDVMSPKRSPREVGVVGKMKEAVTSFLWQEESPQSSVTQLPTNAPTNASTSIPVSTNDHEVFEEANEGRVLQTN
ncbi:hypothetical protein AB3S75_041488 [Citrus x aurantiifolia]